MIRNLADDLKLHRGNMGVRAAAGEIGISTTTLSRIETGAEPAPQTIDKVAAWLGRRTEDYTAMGSLLKPRVSTKVTVTAEAILKANSRYMASAV